MYMYMAPSSPLDMMMVVSFETPHAFMTFSGSHQ